MDMHSFNDTNENIDSETRDEPLSYDWRPTSPIDLAQIDQRWSKKQKKAAEAIIAQIYRVAVETPGRWISYSRTKAWWHKDRFAKTPYSYSIVTGIVQRLADNGLIEHDRRPPGERGRQSRYRASNDFMSRIAAEGFAVDYHPFSLLRLKDHNKNLIPYQETTWTERATKILKEINDATVAADIDCPNTTQIQRAKNQYHRIFNGSFNAGGRLYGPWFQNIPKGNRPSITIDGEATSEADFPSLHVGMLYNLVGGVPDGDPYDICGFERDAVKIAVNILINAEKRRSAYGAIHHGLAAKFGLKPQKLVHAIKKRHPRILRFFGSGAGLYLQRQDADIALQIIQSLLSKNVVALNIHDSFRVQEQHHGLLIETMERALSDYITSPAAGRKVLKFIGHKDETPPPSNAEVCLRFCPSDHETVHIPARTLSGSSDFESALERTGNCQGAALARALMTHLGAGAANSNTHPLGQEAIRRRIYAAADTVAVQPKPSTGMAA
ncbi:hypothetical protein [Fodinicurvata sp. EGI_FJ10296]|uniref:hypothetical protein n=1 Tax=Fodinicurvata sp. EGI_FJ10296 TaxID=3231908 RepID=UPI0034513942